MFPGLHVLDMKVSPPHCVVSTYQWQRWLNLIVHHPDRAARNWSADVPGRTGCGGI